MKRPIESNLKTALVSFVLLLVAASLTACGPQRALQDGAANQLPPFIGDYWRNTVTNERAVLIGTSINTVDPTSLTVTYPGAGGDVECTILANLQGDVKNGLIRIAKPYVFQVSPSTADWTPCDWIRGATSYSIVGNQLTITYGAGTKAFTWNPAN